VLEVFGNAAVWVMYAQVIVKRGTDAVTLCYYLAASQYYVYIVSQKNVPPLTCYITLTHMNGFCFFGRNVTDEVGNRKTLYYAT